MTTLCGARATNINNGITCGKKPHDLNVDPVHRFAAGDPASLTWVEHPQATDRDPLTAPGPQPRPEPLPAPLPTRTAPATQINPDEENR